MIWHWNKGHFLVGNTKHFDPCIINWWNGVGFQWLYRKKASQFLEKLNKWPQCIYSAEQLSPGGSTLVEHECQSNLCNPVVPQNFAGKTPVQEASGHLCFSVVLHSDPKTYQWFKNIFFITAILYSLFHQIIRVDKEVNSFKTLRERPPVQESFSHLCFSLAYTVALRLINCSKTYFLSLYHCNTLFPFSSNN